MWIVDNHFLLWLYMNAKWVDIKTICCRASRKKTFQTHLKEKGWSSSSTNVRTYQPIAILFGRSVLPHPPTFRPQRRFHCDQLWWWNSIPPKMMDQLSSAKGYTPSCGGIWSWRRMRRRKIIENFEEWEEEDLEDCQMLWQEFYSWNIYM